MSRTDVATPSLAVAVPQINPHRLLLIFPWISLFWPLIFKYTSTYNIVFFPPRWFISLFRSSMPSILINGITLLWETITPSPEMGKMINLQFVISWNLILLSLVDHKIFNQLRIYPSLINFRVILCFFFKWKCNVCVCYDRRTVLISHGVGGTFICVNLHNYSPRVTNSIRLYFSFSDMLVCI